jgi:hypothetical protein
MKLHTILAFCFGVVFVTALLVLAILFPKPTVFQYTVFRIVLAIACAGVAAVIPGVLDLKIRSAIRAGGALAVFVIVYFYSPAGLVVEPPQPEPTVSIDLVPETGTCRQLQPPSNLIVELGSDVYSAPLKQRDQSCVAEFYDIPMSAIGKEAHLSFDPPMNQVIDDRDCTLPLQRTMSSKLRDSEQTPRTLITLLPYSASEAGDRDGALRQFKAILQDRLTNTVEALKAKNNAFAYLDKLRLCECSRNLSSVSQLLDYWNATHSLQLWTGSLFSHDKVFTVKSRVFSGYRAGKSTRVDMTIDSTEFEDIRDDHTLVILYGLSQDAQRAGYSTDVVNTYMSKMSDVVRDLKNRRRTVPAEIEAALQEK